MTDNGRCVGDVHEGFKNVRVYLALAVSELQHKSFYMQVFMASSNSTFSFNRV